MKKNFRLILSLLLLVCLGAAPLAPVARAVGTNTLVTFAVPVANSFSTAVASNRQNLLQLQGSDPDSTALTYAIVAHPTHGTLTALNSLTGALIYTPEASYIGGDSFTYTVSSGGETSAAGTVTLSVSNAKTRIIDSITDPGGGPATGKVTFILTQAVTSPSGLIPVGTSVSASLTNGAYDISVYPSRLLSPAAYYQVWHTSGAGRQTLLGVYSIPLSMTTINLTPYQVTDANLKAQYVFASEASVAALSSSISTATLTQLVGGGTLTNLTITGALTAGSINTAGTVTAASFSGNGAGLTGIGTGTGGVINTGSTTIGADSDSNGVGIIDLQTRGTSRLTVENNGALKGSAIRDATGSINVMQYGAKCDGTTDDGPAFLAAINAAVTSGISKTIRIPASTAPCQIATTVTKSFGATYDLIFEGDGSGGQIRLATGASADGFVLSGGNSLTFRNLTILGTTGVIDTRYGFKFNGAGNILFDNVGWYYLLPDADLVLANDSFLHVNGGWALGCASRGDVGYAVFNSTNWKGVHIEGKKAYDYGDLNNAGAITKGGLAFPLAWISVGRPKGSLREVVTPGVPGVESTALAQSTVLIENCTFDEGAQYSVRIFSDIGGGEPTIERVILRNNNTNASGAGGGYYISGTANVEIDNSYIGYEYLGVVSGLALIDAGRVRIRSSYFMQLANQIFIGTNVAGDTKLELIESTYANVFCQSACTLDVTQGGKRRVANLSSGSHSYASLTPSFDLEVPNSLSLGGQATWIKGTGAPAGACSSGSFYSRLDGGVGVPGWYVCENSVWVAK